MFEAAGLATEEEEEEEEFFDCREYEEEKEEMTVFVQDDEARPLTAEEFEDEEVRRDVALMVRLQEQRRAYFEEGIIPEDSLCRAYVFDYYDASTSADLYETEGELSCGEEGSRRRKRKETEDDEDDDDDDDQGNILSHSDKWSMITTNSYFQKCALPSVVICRMIALREGWEGLVSQNLFWLLFPVAVLLLGALVNLFLVLLLVCFLSVRLVLVLVPASAPASVSASVSLPVFPFSLDGYNALREGWGIWLSKE